ncbi:MAG: hypothetical protein ACKO2K_07090 [Alphaproteobacteria bacterium]
MTAEAAIDRGWPTLRYGTLLARAGRSRRAGRAYARAVALRELAADPARRRVARARIERWCGVTGSVVATLHLGSPVLGFVHLSRFLGVVGRAVGRELDDSNPMPAAKRAWGTRKEAWVRDVVGAPFYGTDARALVAARDDLGRGRSVYAAVDVPGDVVARSGTVELCGERVVLSGGMLTLARLAHAPVQLVVTVLDGGLYRHEPCPPIPPGPEDAVARAIAAQASDLVRRHRDQWWLWPFVVPARDDRTAMARRVA